MLDKNKTYLVLNYDGNPVAVSTRHESCIIPGGTNDQPSSMPFSLDEIIQINSNSPVFKMGLLWFEKEFEKDIYEECRIRNWQDILSNEEIEDIIIHPTLAKLEKLLAIENEQYFERCYGIYIGLKNASYAITQNVENIMLARRKELRNRKHKTGILLTKKETTNVTEEALNEAKEQNAKLASEVDELKAMVAQLLAAKQSDTTEKPTAEIEQETKMAEVKTETKKTTRGRPKKNS